MTTWRKVQGDVNDTITVILSGVENLAGATAVAKVWRRDVAAENLTTVITSTVTRTISVALGGATGWLSDAATGNWSLEIQVTFGDGTILTWPAGMPDVINVRVDA